ncbi:anti-sigma factor domain-containing protein [Mesobacillus subterraneus]|uniref:anti-sigma factor domain-containing protein n=1 Tax=Mesobacillus subterraneus TaxID=285983 RepID=UPI00203C3972|nr:anti-sigma factor domain-containing protein [Mesobacillus subterraneus]MCM3573030.1 anti-sigma factor domain-containing protein [Mesobacillus subterraneus]
MRKGVILEINDLYLTLLTPEGEFLRARKLQQDYQVGEEIHFFPETLTVKKKRFNLSFLNSFKTRSIALAAVFMLAMTALVPAYQNGQVYAYMSIDVNPSIELAVNDDLKVLRMKGYNPEGEEIIAEIKDWKKKDAATVAEMILEEIEEEGFFKEKNDVVIATVHNKKAKESVDQKLEKKISEIKKSKQDEDLNFKVMEATSEDREKAQKQGVTTGVYKEKQKDIPRPAVKPADKLKKANPEPGKKKPAETVVPQPEKKVPPGQDKKNNPEVPKGKSNKEKPSVPEKGKGNSNKDKNNNGQGNNKQANKSNKKNNSVDQDGKQYKNEKKPDTQQGPSSKNRGQAGKNKDNPGKK